MPDDPDLRDFRGTTRLFPLPGVVLFPHVVLPLHIFEPRYRQMTEHALASDRLITIVQARPDADWSGPDEPALEAIGCLGKIIQHQRQPDGRFNFLLLGRARVRLIREVSRDTLYRQAEVEILEEREPEAGPDDPRSDLISAFRSASNLDPELAALLRRDLPLGALGDILAHSLGLPASVKQALLEETDVARRTRALIALLGRLSPDPPPPPRPGRPFPPPFSLN